MTLAVAIGVAIYRRRTGMGLSQEELARLSGTKQENISRMETKTGISTSISMLERLAKALDTNPIY
jgi:transcriptional regulator with XRE-family HTH domain